MEHSTEEGRQDYVDTKCQMIVADNEKSSISETADKDVTNIDDKWDIEDSFASPTPQKIADLPRSHYKANALAARAMKRLDLLDEDSGIHPAVECTSVDNLTNALAPKTSSPSPYSESKSQKHERSKLPDKYSLTADLFDRLISSIRLLRLRGKLQTFSKICIQVEILAKRSFQYNHLAQMKYLFPEAIQIEKILVHDESTSCMKPDMKITLLEGGFEGHSGKSGWMALCNTFYERLINFFNAHPESDIPEALLPEPFNKRNDYAVVGSLPLKSSSEVCQPSEAEFETLTSSSHFPTSFCGHFSQKIFPEAEKTSLLDAPVQLSSINSAIGCTNDIEAHEMNEKFAPAIANAMSPARPKITSEDCTNLKFSEITPCKPHRFSTPVKLIETPVQPTPKRSMPSPDAVVSVETPMRTQLAPKRALVFSPARKIDRSGEKLAISEGDEETGNSITNIQVSLPKGKNVAEEITKFSSKGIGLSKRQQMLACLPNLFNAIRHIFLSVHGSTITKQELIHKIIWQSTDIVETGEVEEQLLLLEELAPDWIHGKMVPGGDFLYCLSKTSDPSSVLDRILKAI